MPSDQQICSQCHIPRPRKKFYHQEWGDLLAICKICTHRKWDEEDRHKFTLPAVDFSAITCVPEESLIRMADENELPHYVENGQYYFAPATDSIAVETYEAKWGRPIQRHQLEMLNAKLIAKKIREAHIDRVNNPHIGYVRGPRRGTVVYFIHAEGTNKIKIGITTGDPERRMKALQTGSPVPLKLIGHIDESILGMSEMGLHKKFQSVRVHGEWFQLNTHLSDFIADKLGKTIVCQ